MSELRVRELSAADKPQWRRLWDGYCRFYEATVPEEVTELTWKRLLDPGVDMFALVAELDGEVIGFSHCVVHPVTWVTAPACYLEDLFAHPDHRGVGVGRALLDELLAISRARGYSRVYGHTHRDNATARRLYDHYVDVDAFVRYRISL